MKKISIKFAALLRSRSGRAAAQAQARLYEVRLVITARSLDNGQLLTLLID